MQNDAAIIESYSRLKNLKLVGKEIGMPWQTAYVRLRANSISVVGDKTRYGCAKDKFAAKAEAEFQRLVPEAKNNNKEKFQSKTDFSVGKISVDVKASNLHRQLRTSPARRWAFSVRKQNMIADFMCFFAFSDESEYRLLVAPGELVCSYQTISIGENFSGKWAEFEVFPADLAVFFDSICQQRILG